ncbi:hypothetical protein ARTHRO9V_280027 [Arthrobacter sp. 9V]|nr:hypothetical protein ARTHRO9V_280027 [Arthrobacter sp. 9V]
MKASVKPAEVNILTRRQRFWPGLWVDLKSRRTSVVSSFLGFVISGLLIGVLVPLRIDADAAERERIQRCWDTQVVVREQAGQLRDGFIIQPTAPIPRSSDLRTVRLAVENSEFACREIPAVAGFMGQSASHLDRLEVLLGQSDSGDFRTADDFLKTQIVESLTEWSQSVMQKLGEPRSFRLW